MTLNMRRSLAVIIGAVLFAGGSIFLPDRLHTAAAVQAQVTSTPTATRTPILTSQPTAVTTPSTATTPSAPRTVTVSGSGSAEVTPDMAFVDLGVTTDAETAREALTQNNEQMESLMTALGTAGIATADIRTQTIQLYPRYNVPPPRPDGQPSGPNELVGFTATNTVQVTIRDLADLGQVLDQAVTAGSNQINGIRFDVSDPAAVMDQAREAAMRDAAHKAEQLATLANADLGMVITINESSNRPMPFDAVGGMAGAARLESVPVSPGTQTLMVDVQVTWELR